MTGEFGCKEAVERLWAYLDHELDEVDGRAVEKHLSFCMRCCGELEFAREIRKMLAGAGGDTAMPDATRQHFEAFIRRLDTGSNHQEGATS